MSNFSVFNDTKSLLDNIDMTVSGSISERYELFKPSEAIVSNRARELMAYILKYTITSLVLYIGAVGNVINIAVFFRQGYKQTINISLTAIALWDLLKCILGAFYRFGGPIYAFSTAMAITYKSITDLALDFPAVYCTYVSSVLAAYVAVERCLCVSLPFTVKYLLTPKLVTTVMLVLSVLTFGSFTVSLRIHVVEWRYLTAYNATVAWIFTDSDIPYAALKFNHVIGFIWPAVSLGVQCICAWIISYHLRLSSVFRSGNLGRPKSARGDNSSSSTNGMSWRDRQINKMLLLVILVYIVTMFPRVAISVAKTIEPEFYMLRHYHNLFACLIWVEHLFDYVNASINIIIYYFMSKQYRKSFWEIVRRRRRI